VEVPSKPDRRRPVVPLTADAVIGSCNEQHCTLHLMLGNCQASIQLLLCLEADVGDSTATIS
jgi:hypothetical protein